MPRNVQALFNLGTGEFTVLFHDGRLEADSSRPSGIRTPLGEDMAQAFASLLSAQTDHGFHAIAMSQIGPGKAARFESHARDIGRMRDTAAQKMPIAFRTPSLRSVTETAPYGHSDAFATLRSGCIDFRCAA